MLKKTFRLLVPISKNASTYQTPYFSLKISDNSEEVSRFGFIVSKKIDNRAVVRNRAKRILRNAIERNIDKISTGHDFLFIAKKEIEGVREDQLERETLNILKKEKLYV